MVTRNREVAIVGVAVPKVALSIPDETSLSLTKEAVLGALRDAGLTKQDVNGACLPWPGPGGSPHGGSSNWARVLGVPFNWVVEDGLDAYGIRAILNASAAISFGLCETVVVGCGLAGQARKRAADADAKAEFEFCDPFGASYVQRLALSARRHMHEYGTTPEHLAAAAATVRNYGHRNPEASLFGRGPYAVDDILGSRMIADPLHLLDCCLVGEGACAVVLTSGERARDLPRPPVYVLGGAAEITQGPHFNAARERQPELGATRTKDALSRSGVAIEDVDVLSVYDAASIEIIRSVEMLGFCEQGDGGPFVAEGALGPGGRIPTNTDGGLLSHSWMVTAQLLMRVVEAVRQLRGHADDRQVPGAEVALCSNSAPLAHHIETLILAR